MERELDQINVIPLVDVMLVLLVIVLTTATFISTGQIPVNLAKAKEVGDHKDVPIVITLTAEGVYDYYCVPHELAGMVGRIVVGNPDADPWMQDPHAGADLPEVALNGFPPVAEIMDKGIVRRA